MHFNIRVRVGEYLIQGTINSDSDIQRQILDFCRHIAGSYPIVAICQSDDAIQKPRSKSTIQVLEVILNFQPKIMSYVRIIDGRNIVVFAVDKWVFEGDLTRGLLGEALASLLIFPYTALVNPDYLSVQEISLKKRLILESLANIVLNYPEYSYTMRIKPEYFMYEIMLSRVRIFPPMAYSASPFLRGEIGKEKVALVLQGYLKALKQLNKAEIICDSKNEIMISETFVQTVQTSKKPHVRLINTIKIAPRTMFTSFFGVFPQFLNFLSQNYEAFSHFQMFPWRNGFNVRKKFIDPQRFILVPTTQGFVSLADKLDIRGYVKKVLSPKFNKISINKYGGVLNDVYLIKASTDHLENKILVKQFKDLSSFKWFPLSMWSVGARSFSLLGKSRLERECAINELLNREGFNVPKIFHVSTNERLVFMEYIEGKSLSSFIKKIASAKEKEYLVAELDLIEQVGEIYAKVHNLNVVLGDAKPDNILISKSGKLYLIDFEQAGRNGDKTWDVAEFLFFAGHYLQLNSESKAEAIANAFIKGYLFAGGDFNVIRSVGMTKYTRVFSVYTLPSILLAMVNICKKTKPLVDTNN